MSQKRERASTHRHNKRVFCQISFPYNVKVILVCFHYDGLQPKMRAGMIKEHECIKWRILSQTIKIGSEKKKMYQIFFQK